MKRSSVATQALFIALVVCVCPSLISARRVNVIERSVHGSGVLSQIDSEFTLSTAGNASNHGKPLLPVFFFHGITNGPSEGSNIAANLTAEGRAVVALSFCPNACSTRPIRTQTRLAIAQIRSIVQKDSRFDNGYIFIAQSQGGIIARSVIEEMDDHRVHTFISLAGVQNGVFYGPQQEDQAPLQVLLAGFGAKVVPRDILDFDGFASDPSSLRGELQRDLAKLSIDRPELEDEYSFVNLARFPAFNDWVKTNKFLPVLNNVNVCDAKDRKCEQDKQRRKRNFTKLKAAHFFASPNDGIVAPWQISLFGRYSEVSTVDEIESKFEELTIVDMRDTLEYANDTFGLRTLDERGSLFLHQVPGVSHGCWVHDCWRSDDPTQFCEWQPNYDRHVYSLLS